MSGYSFLSNMTWKPLNKVQYMLNIFKVRFTYSKMCTSQGHHWWNLMTVSTWVIQHIIVNPENSIKLLSSQFLASRGNHCWQLLFLELLFQNKTKIK